MIKKLIYILILIITFANPTFATPKNARIEYNNNPYAYNKPDAKQILKKANVSMLLWEKSLTDFDRNLYLELAMRNYYLATKIDGSLMEAHLGLARVYDAMNLDRLSKKYFFDALNLGTYNPKTNFYFANFYYKRADYLKALSYYKIAYEHGYSKNYELNYKIAIIYEKIADIESAKEFYNRALKLRPNEESLAEKIRILDELNYGNSQYYLFHKK